MECWLKPGKELLICSSVIGREQGTKHFGRVSNRNRLACQTYTTMFGNVADLHGT